VQANQGAAGGAGPALAEVDAAVATTGDPRGPRRAAGRSCPPPVRRVERPQGEGRGPRACGMPTVAARVAPAVVTASLEPERA